MYLTRPFYQKCNSDADIGGYTESTVDDDIYWSFSVNDESLRMVEMEIKRLFMHMRIKQCK